MIPRVYLGTHKPEWLPRLGVPLFLSQRRMAERVKLPRAAAPWALDSGGFTELNKYGRWMTGARDYARAAERYAAEVGRLQWAAIQDWMCEPFVLKKTGLSIAEHQRRTVDSYAELLDLAPLVPWAPVLQGWAPSDYLRHIELYDARGLDLRGAPVVGIGSVCRLQHTAEAESRVRAIARALPGVPLHGFGFKLRALRRAADVLASVDSLAWSFDARHRPPLKGCKHKSCSNCQLWALRWLEKANAAAREGGRQMVMVGSEHWHSINLGVG